MRSKAWLVTLVTLQGSLLVAGLATYACEGEMLGIHCNFGNILILSAKFGRQPGHVFKCGDNLMLQKVCKTDATQYMRYRCEGMTMCEVYVDTATFLSDPCPDVLKYMEVEYQCVAANSFANVGACVEKCMATGGNPCSASPVAGLHQPAPQVQSHPTVNLPSAGPQQSQGQSQSTRSGQQSSGTPSASAPSPNVRQPSASSSSSQSHFSGVASLPYGPDQASSGTSGATGSLSWPLVVPGSSKQSPAVPGTNTNSVNRAALMARLSNVLSAMQNRAG